MARKHNIVIVGAGLFGAVAAALARAKGHNVTTIDSSEHFAASKASGCVLAPSWLSSLTREQIDTAMGVLGDLYTIHDVEFQTNVIKTFKAKRIAPGDILSVPTDIPDRVRQVGDGVVFMEDGTKHKGKVLVAAGIATKALVGELMPDVKGQWGASVRLKAQLEAPRIHAYAPYRQVVMFNISRSEVWGGDGTALIEKTWRTEEADRIAATVARVRDIAGIHEGRHKTFAGARPYVEGHKAGYFARIHPSTWVSTGGAKNGTVLAAWQADQFMKELA